MSTGEMASAKMIITGHVQGVFFRRAAAEQARLLGIKGWARNLADGSVEIVAEGTRSNLERFVEWARHGPPLARVEAVDVQWGEYKGRFTRFQVG
jgi:acylphosphatase